MSPSGMPTDDREEQREDGQLDRHRQPLDQQLRDRAAECLIELPRSPAASWSEVDAELDRDRLVEAVASVERRADARRSPARRGRPRHGSPGMQPRQREHEEDDPEQDRDA